MLLLLVRDFHTQQLDTSCTGLNGDTQTLIIVNQGKEKCMYFVNKISDVRKEMDIIADNNTQLRSFLPSF